MRSIPLEQIGNWLAWREGSPEWLPLRTFTELFQRDDSDYTGEPFPEPPPVTRIDVSIAAVNTQSHSSFDFSDNDAMAAESSFNRAEVTSTSSYISNVDNVESSLEPSLQEPTRTQTKLLEKLGEHSLPDIQQLTRTGRSRIAKAPAESGSTTGQVFVLDDGAMAGFDGEIEVNSFQSDRRESSRYRQKLSAAVDWGGPAMLATKTVDLSINGIRLERPVPYSAKKHAKIVLSRGMDSVEALCEGIPEPDGKTVLRFRILSINRLDLLRTWLLNPSA